jgi:hypothetical protein
MHAPFLKPAVRAFTLNLAAADVLDVAVSKTLYTSQISTAPSFEGKHKSWKFEWLLRAIFQKQKAPAPRL